MRLFFLGLIALLLSSNLHAWQLNLRTDDNGEAFITASSSITLTDVQVYLTWFNLDTAEVQSWTIADGWRTGIVPIIEEVVSNVSTFAEQVVAALPASCDSSENCFVSFVAVPEGIYAANSTRWQAGTVLPLTARAGQSRLTGQQFFLPVTEAITVADSAENAATNPDGSTSMAWMYSSTQPEIVQLVGQYLYYVNNAASRLQIIDLSDIAAPRMLAEARLSETSTPQALYVLNDRMLLWQETEQGSQATVWQLSAAEQQLQKLSEQNFTGDFIASHRRDNVIYTALSSISTQTAYLDGEAVAPTEICRTCITQQNIDVYALQLAEDGQLTVLGQTVLPSYGYGYQPDTDLFSEFFGNSAPKVSFFEQYLVLISRQQQNWLNSFIQVVSLADVTQPLQALPTVQLAGHVISEFQVTDDVLKVLYQASDNTQGIGLAVFDLSTGQPSLVGQLSGVVFEETVQSVRFVGDNIYLMTQQVLEGVNTAFLRVINSADPSAPTLLSNTPLPMEAGESDSLFFSDTRLLSLGSDNVQTAEDIASNTIVNRVSLSLFDISDPTNPSLLSHFLPFQSVTTHSYSNAGTYTDQLLLDWAQEYVVVPIYTYAAFSDQMNNALQVVSLRDDTLSDAGSVRYYTPLHRTIALGEGQLAGLGNQELQTVQLGDGTAQKVSALELSYYLYRLKAQAGAYWAAPIDINRFFRYDDPYAMRPSQTWTLDRSFFNMVLDDTQAIFYRTDNTSSFQRLLLESGELQAPVEMVLPNAWFDRTNALLTPDALHFGELLQVENTGCFSETVCVLPSWTEWLSSLVSAPKQWVLKSWPVEGGQSEPVVRSITGRPVAFTAEGLLITEEETLDGQLRLSLLSLSETAAHLVTSAVLPCVPTFKRTGFYGYYSFGQTQMVFDAAQGDLWLNCSGDTYHYMSSTDFENEVAQNVTRLYRLSPSQQFAVTGEWSFVGHKALLMATENTLLFRQAATTYYYDYTADELSEGMIGGQLTLWSEVANQCQVAEMTESGQFTVLSEFDYCSDISTMAFSPSQVVFAGEYAGLKTIGW